jgi:hypothetical protein
LATARSGPAAEDEELEEAELGDELVELAGAFASEPQPASAVTAKRAVAEAATRRGEVFMLW